MKTRKTTPIVAIAMMLILILSQAAFAAKPIVAKYAHQGALGSAMFETANKFAELVEAKTNGEIKVEVFPNSQLGSGREYLESMKMGALEFGQAVGGIYSMFEPQVTVLALPFLFESREQVYSVLDGPIGEEIYGTLEKHGFKYLGTVENGFRQLYTIKPVNSIGDLKGIKLRVPEGELYQKVWKALGVNPTPIPWNECFTALQTKVIDGLEPGLVPFETAGLGEVARNIAFINYSYDPDLLSVSTAFWNKLTEGQQAAIREATKEAIDFHRARTIEMEKEIEVKLQEKYATVFTHPDLKPFQDATRPVLEEFKYIELLNKILAHIGKDPIEK